MRRIFILLAAAASLVIVAAPAQAQSTFTIDSASLVNDFQAQVNGTIVCYAGDNLFINVELHQRPTTSAFGFAPDQICTGNPQTWTVTTSPSNRPLHPGPALVNADATVCDPFFFDCTVTNTSEEIRLTK